MLLRERQKVFVHNCVQKLFEKKNTLGVAPTGAGKTVCMAAIAAEVRPKLTMPIMVLQHRDELVTQNSRTFVRYMGMNNIHPRVIDANSKIFDNRKGGVHFAMIQTLCRGKTLNAMPPIGMLMIDEAHHAVADSYQQVIHDVKGKNPDVLIYGTTATPNRGDKKGLKGIFNNCADQITIKELIASGHLVRPSCYVVDVGARDDLNKVKRTAQDFDMSAVAAIMNKRAINEEVLSKWRGFTDEKTGQWVSCADKQTIIFCSTVEHAQDVEAVFKEGGVSCAVVHGDLGKKRGAIIQAYEREEIQVLINVAVLTEGFDHPPTAAVILLRPSSWKSTMAQMIGRGLRKLDPEKYPGRIKDTCIVLDFGTSLLIHGDLSDDADLAGAGIKSCPSCESDLPEQTRDCPICGYEFPFVTQGTTKATTGGGGGEKGEFGGFAMTEIDILGDSPFQYESLAGGLVQLASAFTAFAIVITYTNGRFYALGGRSFEDANGTYRQEPLKLLANADNYLLALQTADDHMREYGDKATSQKSKRWLHESPTQKQLDMLEKKGVQLSTSERYGMTKYRAACMLTWEFNWSKIKSKVQQAAQC